MSQCLFDASVQLLELINPKYIFLSTHTEDATLMSVSF